MTLNYETLKNQIPPTKNGYGPGRFATSNEHVFVNIPFWEPFVKYSPFSYRNGNLYNLDELVDTSLEFAPSPDWLGEKLSSGKYAGQIIQPHGKQNLATMIFGCDLQTDNSRCKFCTAPFYTPGSERKLNDILESLSLALKENPSYSLSINAGTFTSEGRGLEITIPYLEKIRKSYPDLGVLLEIAPPKESSWLKLVEKVNNKGDLGLMFNLNFWSDAALNIVEPGKNKLIPKEEYISIWQKSIEIFGKGSTSSCILVGVEAEQYTRDAIDYLTSIGVIPEVIMFRPTLGSDLGKVPRDPALFIRTSQYAKQRMKDYRIEPAQVGCVNCGGCSLTTMETKYSKS